jgi:hypothetical protein
MKAIRMLALYLNSADVKMLFMIGLFQVSTTSTSIHLTHAMVMLTGSL